MALSQNPQLFPLPPSICLKLLNDDDDEADDDNGNPNVGSRLVRLADWFSEDQQENNDDDNAHDDDDDDANDDYNDQTLYLSNLLHQQIFKHL